MRFGISATVVYENGSRVSMTTQIPSFQVNAANEAEAKAVAQDIIMTAYNVINRYNYIEDTVTVNICAVAL